jgi:hypothetical protein
MCLAARLGGYGEGRWKALPVEELLTSETVPVLANSGDLELLVAEVSDELEGSA